MYNASCTIKKKGKKTMREVVAQTTQLTVDNLDSTKGYVMDGRKGKFIIARDTDGKFIWVRLNPPKTTAKSVKSYSSLKEAVKDKLDRGYQVFEYSEIEVM
jgi:hypothetical protein